MGRRARAGHREAAISDQRPPTGEAPRADRGFRILAGILDESARHDVQDVLYDPVTELPSLQFLLTQIRNTLEARDQVGLITQTSNIERHTSPRAWKLVVYRSMFDV